MICCGECGGPHVRWHRRQRTSGLDKLRSRNKPPYRKGAPRQSDAPPGLIVVQQRMDLSYQDAGIRDDALTKRASSFGLEVLEKHVHHQERLNRFWRALPSDVVRYGEPAAFPEASPLMEVSVNLELRIAL